MTRLTVEDEVANGGGKQSITLEFPAEQITVEELIRSRVFLAAKDANVSVSQQPARDAIIEPTADEVALNGPRRVEPKQVDWHKEFERAIQAFQTNRVLIFINDEQVTQLDHVITVEGSTQVRFLRLNMLMGG